jgi:hypothetical protein
MGRGSGPSPHGLRDLQFRGNSEQVRRKNGERLGTAIPKGRDSPQFAERIRPKDNR